MKSICLLATLLVTTYGSAIPKDLSAPIICPIPCLNLPNCDHVVPGDYTRCECPKCVCDIEGQEYTYCGSDCPPTCANPIPSCYKDKQCVQGCQCPAGTVLDEVIGKCVQIESCTCPPECTKDFCTKEGNEYALCSVPGPREIPGCTGRQCPLTYCGACYFDEDVRSLPEDCGTCGSPISSLNCLETWAGCIHKADISQHGEPDPSYITQKKFKCYRYPCMLRG